MTIIKFSGTVAEFREWLSVWKRALKVTNQITTKG